MRDVRRQVAALGALVLQAERHLEAEQDEQRHPEVAEQEPPGHGTRSRKPTPRTVSIQPGSPSFRRSAATWTSIVFEEPYQLVCQTSASKPLPAHGRAGIARERGEQLELLRRQLELAAVEACAACALVDLEVSGAQRAIAAGKGRRAPHYRADPGDQLAQPVRLDDVVVGAELEPDHAVGLFPTCGEDDDRDARALAQLPADVEPVDVRQAQIEQDEVRGRGIEGALARRYARDVVALTPQTGHQGVGNSVLVFDDQDVHVSSVAAPGPLGIRN